MNAEHDGTVVVTIGRELERDVIDELNRAFDWLKAEGVSRVIWPATSTWRRWSARAGGVLSRAPEPPRARGFRGLVTHGAETRDDFETSVGFVNGKRCLGGMLEVMVHCHHLMRSKMRSLIP